MTLILKPNFKFPAKDMKEFLALVSIGFPAIAAWFDAEEMRFHSGVAPGEQFHTDIGTGFENLAIGGMHESGGVAIGFEKRKKIGFVKTCDAAKRSDGRAHLPAFQCAEKTDGYAGSTSDLCERKIALKAQATKTLAGRLARVGGNNGKPLLLQNVNNGGGIQSAGAAKKDRSLQETNVGFGVETVAALGTLRSDEAKSFPGTQSGRRDAEASSDFRDAQKALVWQRFRYGGQILSA